MSQVRDVKKVIEKLERERVKTERRLRELATNLGFLDQQIKDLRACLVEETA